MKMPTLALLILISICGHAQNCKFDKNLIDNVTHVHKYEKKIEKIHWYKSDVSSNIVITICKYDSNFFFRLNIDENNGFTSVRPENAFVFGFDDGTTVTAHPDTVYSSEIDRTDHSNAQPTIFEGTYHFDSQNDVSKFYMLPVKSIRMYHDYGYTDYTLKEKHIKSILQVFGCLK